MCKLPSLRNGFWYSIELSDLNLQPLGTGLMMQDIILAISNLAVNPILGCDNHCYDCSYSGLLESVGSFHFAFLLRATHVPLVGLLHDTSVTDLPGHEHWDLLSCPGGAWWHDSGHSVQLRGGQSGSPAWHHPQELCAAGDVWRIPHGPPGLPCEVGRAHSVAKEYRTVTSSISHSDSGT